MDLSVPHQREAQLGSILIKKFQNPLSRLLDPTHGDLYSDGSDSNLYAHAMDLGFSAATKGQTLSPELGRLNLLGPMESKDLMVQLHDFAQIGSNRGRVHKDKLFLKEFLNPGFVLDASSNTYSSYQIRNLGLALF